MFDLFAVQAAPRTTEGAVTFEEETGSAEWLHLGEYPAPAGALAALAAAHRDKATRPTWQDETVKPPLWGHELFQRRRPDSRTDPLCVARAHGLHLTLTAEFAGSVADDLVPDPAQGSSLTAIWD